jgi:nucleotide-binding universal stress UspA family protein
VVREKLTAETRSTARALVEAFDSELDRSRVRHVEHVREGVPDRRIVEEMKYHDLLLIGRTPHFFYPRPEKRTPTLVKVVKNGIAPTFVVPETEVDVSKVLIAYDGSNPSARAMQRFAQLAPFGTELEIELLHVRPWVGERAQRESELRLRLAADFLKSHGFESVRETSLAMDQPDRRVLSYAQEVHADLIVAGAHSVSAVKRMAFGSTTRALLEHCEVPFFLYN